MSAQRIPTTALKAVGTLMVAMNATATLDTGLLMINLDVMVNL